VRVSSKKYRTQNGITFTQKLMLPKSINKTATMIEARRGLPRRENERGIPFGN